MSKALSKKHLTTEQGQQLLAMLLEITKDGTVDTSEVEKLRTWLLANQTSTTIPGIAWLLELIDIVLADGKIGIAERFDLLQAFDRVLPPDERLLSKARRRIAGTDKCPAMATAPQIAYLTRLGATIDPDLTMQRASEMLDELLEQKRDVSNRLMMVLRFWNKVDVAQRGKEGVMDWVDEWYEEDPRRKIAWEKWKLDHGDDGRQADPSRVPIGAGFDYLKKVPIDNQPMANSQPSSAGPSILEQFGSWLLVKLLQAAIVIGLLIWLLRAIFTPKT